MNKICHVISGYYRTDTRIFHRQCISLKNNGYKVSIYTNDGEKSETIDGIKIYSTKSWKRWKVLLFAKKQFLKSLIELNYDIYQLHSPELLPLVKPLKKLNKKVIYDAHEDMPNHIKEKEWIPVFLRIIISKLYKIYQDHIFKKIDYLISPHHHIINKENLKRKKVIPNFPLIHKKESTKLNEYLNRSDMLCYTGTVYFYSNQKEIFKSLEYFPKLKYKIPGYIDDVLLDEFKGYKSYNQFEYLGRLSLRKLQDFYKTSTIGIVIYDYKLNLGYNIGSYGTNKIFEYMEAGIPLICTDYKLWKDVVEKYKCGICVEPKNYVQIKEALEFLINNKKKAFEMGQNGIKAVNEKFNWKVVEKDYLKIFNQL